MSPEHFVEWRCPIHGSLLDASCMARVRCGHKHQRRRCNRQAVAFLRGKPVSGQDLRNMRKARAKAVKTPAWIVGSES